MATDEALAYLLALSVPVWLLIEQGVAWLRARKREARRAEAAPAAPVVEGESVATRKAA
jgi:hypothetical protein